MLTRPQTLWTSSEAEPSGGEAPAAAAPGEGDNKETADAPAGTEDKPAQ